MEEKKTVYFVRVEHEEDMKNMNCSSRTLRRRIGTLVGKEVQSGLRNFLVIHMWNENLTPHETPTGVTSLDSIYIYMYTYISVCQRLT